MVKAVTKSGFRPRSQGQAASPLPLPPASSSYLQHKKYKPWRKGQSHKHKKIRAQAAVAAVATGEVGMAASASLPLLHHGEEDDAVDPPPEAAGTTGTIHVVGTSTKHSLRGCQRLLAKLKQQQEQEQQQALSGLSNSTNNSKSTNLSTRIQALELQIESLQAQRDAHHRSDVDRKFARQSHGVRFLERQRLSRTWRKLNCKQSNIINNSVIDNTSIDKTIEKRRLLALALDQCYVAHYPFAALHDKYVPLTRLDSILLSQPVDFWKDYNHPTRTTVTTSDLHPSDKENQKLLHVLRRLLERRVRIRNSILGSNVLRGDDRDEKQRVVSWIPTEQYQLIRSWLVDTAQMSWQQQQSSSSDNNNNNNTRKERHEKHNMDKDDKKNPVPHDVTYWTLELEWTHFVEPLLQQMQQQQQRQQGDGQKQELQSPAQDDRFSNNQNHERVLQAAQQLEAELDAEEQRLQKEEEESNSNNKIIRMSDKAQSNEDSASDKDSSRNENEDSDEDVDPIKSWNDRSGITQVVTIQISTETLMDQASPAAAAENDDDDVNNEVAHATFGSNHDNSSTTSGVSSTTTSESSSSSSSDRNVGESEAKVLSTTGVATVVMDQATKHLVSKTGGIHQNQDATAASAVDHDDDDDSFLIPIHSKNDNDKTKGVYGVLDPKQVFVHAQRASSRQGEDYDESLMNHHRRGDKSQGWLTQQHRRKRPGQFHNQNHKKPRLRYR